MKKKILSISLAVSLLLSLVLVQAGPAGAATDPSVVIKGGGVSGTYYSNVELFDVVVVELTQSSKNSAISATGRFTPSSSASAITIHSDLAIAGTSTNTREFKDTDLTGTGFDELLLSGTFIGDSNIQDSTALDGVINEKDVKIVNVNTSVALTPGSANHYTAAEDTASGKLRITITPSGKAAMGAGVPHRASYKTHKYALTSTDGSVTPIVVSPLPAVVQGAVGRDVSSATEAGELDLTSDAAGGTLVVVTFKFNSVDTVSGVSVTSTTATARGLGASIKVTETGPNTGLFKNSVGVATAAERDLIASRVPVLGSDTVTDLLADPVISLTDNAGIRAKITEWTGGTIGITSDIVVAGTTLSGSSKASVLLTNIIPVADTDSITVTSGSLSDFGIADLTAPSITLKTPATKSFTNITAPVFELEVEDTGSGIKRTTNAIDVVLKHLPGSTTLTFNEGSSPALFVSVLTTDRKFLLRPLSGTFNQGDVDWWVKVEDRVGNEPGSKVDGASSRPWRVTVDTQAPVISTAETGITYDTAFGDETGFVNNSVKVTFDTKRTGPSSGFTPAGLDSASFTKADFRVGGVEPVAITKVSGAIVYLEVGNMASDAKPSAEVVNNIKDKAGNTLVISTATSSQKKISKATDKIPPTLTLTVDASLSKSESTLTVTSDEPLSGGIPTVTISPSTTAGTLNTVSTTEWNRKDTITNSGAVHTWTVQASDAAANNQEVLKESVTSQIDGIATVIQLSRKPILDMPTLKFKDGDTSVGPTSLSVSSTNTSDGQITLSAAPVVGDKLVVSYEYRDTVKFEGDKRPPTLSLLFGATSLSTSSGSPTKIEGDITQNQADAGQLTVLRLTASFKDSSEYTGDTHKKVAVTSATLDGADVSGSLFSTDDIVYVLVSNLTLGVHFLIITGKDDAGNSVTTTGHFKIGARAPYSIILSPGWNLVSLPATPAELPGADGVFGTSDDINSTIGSVLTGLTKAEAVLEFDPATGSFKSSTYNATTALWLGSVTDIDANKAYWVFASAFQTVNVSLQKRGPTTPLPAVNLKAGYNYIPFNTLVDPVPSNMKSLTGGVDADVFLNSIKGSWTSLIRFDPDPAISWQVLVPNGVGWNNANPAGADGLIGVGVDRIYGTADDDSGKAADDVKNAIPNVQAGRGYIIFLTKDATLTPSQ